MPIRKYRKKPVIIEAVQITAATFDAPRPNPEHLPGVIYNPVKREAWVATLEGTMTASMGDWLIIGIKGEIYPCKSDIFERTYESIESC